MLESGKNICTAVKTIKGDPRYASWIDYTKTCESQMKDLMMQFKLLDMVNADFITSGSMQKIN